MGNIFLNRLEASSYNSVLFHVGLLAKQILRLRVNDRYSQAQSSGLPKNHQDFCTNTLYGRVVIYVTHARVMSTCGSIIVILWRQSFAAPHDYY